MSRRSGLMLCSVLLLAGALAGPPVRADNDTLGERSDSTFQLLPSQGVVRVTIDLAITSRKAATVAVVPCPYDRSLSCRQTTSYYTNEWGYVWVPFGAQDLRVSGATARLESTENGWRNYMLSFRPVYYGQTRRIRVRFDLPTAKPRSANPVRVTPSYSYFCWNGQATDTGTVVARLPRGYEQDTFGDKVRTKRTGKGVEIRAVRRSDMGEFWACTDAFDLEGLITTQSTSPSGRTILVEGWPEDPDWSEAITEAIGVVLPELEAHVGLPIPGDGDIVVRQVARQALRGYAGEYQTGSDLIRINERFDDEGLVAHELAHAWFDGDLSREDWLLEGYTSWLEVSAQGAVCRLVVPPEDVKPLRDWRYLPLRPTDAERARVSYQYDAACSIIGQVADAIGDDRMRDVMKTLLTDGRAYDTEPIVESTAAGPSVSGAPPMSGSGGTPVIGRDKPVDWREWLDVVQEVGLLPAGADPALAQELLLRFGIARAKDLKGRSDARTAYHELLGGLDGHRAPVAVRDPLDRWRFGAAQDAIAVAGDVAAEIQAATTGMTPDEVEAAWTAFEEARTVKALRALGE